MGAEWMAHTDSEPMASPTSFHTCKILFFVLNIAGVLSVQKELTLLFRQKKDPVEEGEMAKMLSSGPAFCAGVKTVGDAGKSVEVLRTTAL